jgi:tetratricopeptide (TPR) repeat protein
MERSSWSGDRARWAVLDAAFAELAALEPEAREAVLAERFPDDALLAARLRQLLAAERSVPAGFLAPASASGGGAGSPEAAGFLEAGSGQLVDPRAGSGAAAEDRAVGGGPPGSPPPAAGASTSGWRETPGGGPSLGPLPLPVGSRLGAWRLAAVLGRGGAGTVYLASQPGDPRAELVAIKLLQVGLGSSGHERLQRERRVLSRLEHPAVARLLDAGVSETGLPYLVLQYVPGLPLDGFVEGTRASLEMRLLLAIDLCGAVAALHRHLVLHLDLKPANILVTARGQVRLVDFGVASLFEEVAEEGRRWLTPRYASPEQLAGRPLGTGSDIYSLGVVLYELLAGVSPFALPAEASVGEWQRLVAEREAPLASERVAGLPTPDGGLARRLRGDLDAILARALRLEPQARYPSAEALAEDLARVLRHEAVLARRGNLWYRLGKAARRHWLSVATAAALVATLVGHSWQTATERAVAESERRRAESALDLVVHAMRSAEASAAGDVGAEAASGLSAAIEDVVGLAEHDPLLVGRVLGSLGRIQAAKGEIAQARASLARAWRILRAERGPTHQETMAALQDLAIWHLDLGQTRVGARLLALVLAHRQQVSEPGDPELTATMEYLGRSLLGSDPERARGLLEEALARRRADAGTPPIHLAGSLDGVAGVAADRGERERAEGLVAEALAIREAAGLSQTLPQADSLALSAWLLRSRGDLSAALEQLAVAHALRVRWLGEGHPRSLSLASARVETAIAAGRTDEAWSLARAAQRAATALPEDSPRRLRALYDLAAAAVAAAEVESAEAALASLAERVAAGGLERNASAELALRIELLEGRLMALRGDSRGAVARHRQLLERLVSAPPNVQLALSPMARADLERWGEPR